MSSAWKILGCRELLSVGRRLRVFVEHVRLPDGREIEDYLQFVTPAVVAIVARTQDGQFVCERHYKHGAKRIILTLPAGGVEPNEDPLAAAQRELLEETGYATQNWQFLGSGVLHANAGGGPVHSFLATDCRAVAKPYSGDLEEISIELKSSADVLSALSTGEMPLVLDLAALMRAFLVLGVLVQS
jgi:ADP-ribose pyrophosphatase